MGLWAFWSKYPVYLTPWNYFFTPIGALRTIVLWIYLSDRSPDYLSIRIPGYMVKLSLFYPLFYFCVTIGISLYLVGGSERVQRGFSEGSVRVQWGFNEVHPSEPPRNPLERPSKPPRKALERPSEPPRKYEQIIVKKQIEMLLENRDLLIVDQFLL